MARYRVYANVKSVYVAEDDVVFEIEAIDENDARKNARCPAIAAASVCVGMADFLENEVFISEKNGIELIEETDVFTQSPRCKETEDMFAKTC